MKFVIATIALLAQSVCSAQLSFDQFVEAVDTLSLEPDSLAAAGVPESSVQPLWDSLRADETAWAAYATARDAMRSAAIRAGNETGDEQRERARLAAADVTSLVTSWRQAVCAPLTPDVQTRLTSIASQSTSRIPPYLLVIAWPDADLFLLQQGYAEAQRSARMDQASDDELATFYQNALQRFEVVTAKANFDVRSGLYAQRFTDFITSIAQ